ncbi:DEAD/DEAH box helicase family protein [Acinetobacter sp. ANC 4635]|uniref:DEAD/DEAH box helicase family protein n=1 Tax=Acinetobacter sp. ANC 4635 TaxID=2529846 RepID=UPI001D18961C|nr:DEAD/DEAH box helicase family protein [Acinetobacter sp. ANC 4635]
MHALLVSAEAAYYSAPAHTLVQTRKFAEAFVNRLAYANKIEFTEQTDFVSRIRRLENELDLKTDLISVLHTLRKNGNKGAHELSTNHSDALSSLVLSYKVAQWLYQVTQKGTKVFKPYKAPEDPTLETRRMRVELMELQQQLRTAYDKHAVNQEIQQKNIELEAENQKLKQQQYAEAEELKLQLTNLEKKIKELEQQPAPVVESIDQAQLKVANQSFELSEAETRLLIDKQLNQVGWVTDTELLTFAKGVRPQEGLNLAIAEYPTVLNGEKGEADYVLFAGLIPIAVVEAKKQNKMVSSFISQAERYSQGFQVDGDLKPAYTIGDYQNPWQSENKTFHIPFVYSCNGQPYSQRLIDEGGIWFRDVREPSNLRRVLQGFHSPHGLLNKLKYSAQIADKYLEKTDILAFNNRTYQREGIKAVENAIASGNERCLLAMATGTGKTRLATGLMYRLLESNRFQRVLFLVDRSSLNWNVQMIVTLYVLIVSWIHSHDIITVY